MLLNLERSCLKGKPLKKKKKKCSNRKKINTPYQKQEYSFNLFFKYLCTRWKIFKYIDGSEYRYAYLCFSYSTNVLDYYSTAEEKVKFCVLYV